MSIHKYYPAADSGRPAELLNDFELDKYLLYLETMTNRMFQLLCSWVNSVYSMTTSMEKNI